MDTKDQVWIVFRYVGDSEDATFAGAFGTFEAACEYSDEVAARFTDSTFAVSSYKFGDTVF